MINAFNHITLAVKDIYLSFQFYRDVLGLQPLCRWDKGAYFLIGDFWFCLNVDAAREANSCYTHYAFSVAPADFLAVSERITQAGAIIFKENTSPGDSLYFMDPDGHKLEVHTGNWQSRIQAKKQTLGSWKEVEWFV
jgi:catechol 2,3-dioxygenase-like lactoylglutathione lyase family enzyme